MTMHRRPLGRGRTLAAVAGRADGRRLRPAVVAGRRHAGHHRRCRATAWPGSGILVFLVGIATLALVALPYAAGDRPLGLDRWLSFAILAVAGWIGFGWRVVELADRRRLPVQHARPGLHQRPRAVARRDRPGDAVARGLDDDPRAGLPLTVGRARMAGCPRIDRLEGVWNIVPTPFLDDGELDEAQPPDADPVRGRVRAWTA